MNAELKNIISSTSYLTPSRYISGRIVEYDIRSANITMLRKYGKIDDHYYNYLSRLPKENREIEVGLMIKQDKSYYDTIRDGIIKAKYDLFLANNIELHQVCRIANDAVYVNKAVDLPYTIFDDIEFVKKSIWTNMVILSKHLVLFSYRDGANTHIDVKGINKEAIQLHSNYMLTFLFSAINIMETGSTKAALEYITSFVDDYLNLRLDKEYYRELTPYSLYKYKNTNFYLMQCDDLSKIDINYNFKIIRELYAIILEKYNIEIRR